MKTIGGLSIVAALLTIWIWNYLPFIDDLKLMFFNKACNNATEHIYKTVNTDSLEFDYWPYSGVMEDEYYPIELAGKLLSGDSRLKSIRLAYEMPRAKVVNSSCAGRFVVLATKPEELRIGRCGKMLSPKDVESPRYAVRYEYGAPNLFSIRPFRIFIEDTRTAEIIAEQKSFQLLLGHMNRSANRRWYGWGSAQGAKVCPLPKPRGFIMRALDQNG